MKSDSRTAVRLDDGILSALEERAHGLQPGDAVALADLCGRDPYGAEAFTLLASRFGLARQDAATWRLEKQPRWLPGWIGPEHEAQCFDLFEKAFGYRIAPALWRWKYRDAPNPGMGAWRDGELVAFYGGMPRPVRFLGQPALTLQIGDVMVHPAERGVMTRSGAFRIAASIYINRSAGHGRPYLTGFGFPTSKHLQVAHKLGLYEQVDQVAELVWPAGEGWNSRLLRVEKLGPAHGSCIDSAWEAMAQDFRDSVLGVRDAAYVQRRYLEHPTVAYECLLVRKLLTGAVQGVAVMRLVDPGQAELMDLIGPRRHFPALVAAARRWAHRQGAVKLRAWVTASHAHLLDGTHPTVNPMDLAVPAPAWNWGISPDELRNRWWLMAGDTDFR